MRNRWLVPAGAAAAVLVIAACGSSGNGGSGGSGGSGSSPAASSGSALKTMKVGSATVVANSNGHALYWFALDTSDVPDATARQRVLTYLPLDFSSATGIS